MKKDYHKNDKWYDCIKKRQKKWKRVDKWCYRKVIFSYIINGYDEWCNDIHGASPVNPLELEIRIYKYFDLRTFRVTYGGDVPNHSTCGYRNKNDALAEMFYLLTMDGVVYMRLKEKLQSLGYWKYL